MQCTETAAYSSLDAHDGNTQHKLWLDVQMMGAAATTVVGPNSDHLDHGLVPFIPTLPPARIWVKGATSFQVVAPKCAIGRVDPVRILTE